MKIEALDSTGEYFSVIVIEHNGEKLEWNANDYERGNDRSSDSVFKHINQYFNYLPIERQNNIWESFKRIKNVMKEIFDVERMHQYLKDEIGILYSYMPLEEMTVWVKVKSDIFIPLNIKENYEPGDPVERTYIKKDYMDLIVFSLALRPMVPIWSEYNSIVKGVIGNHYKEYQSLGILSKTELLKSGDKDNVTAIDKLRTYIEITANIITDSGTDGRPDAAILGGLGTEELPDWLLALSIVRRVGISDLDGNSDKGSIIANVYRYITNTIKSLDKRFKGKIRNKDKPTGDDDDNASVIEGYKVKQEQSDGDLVTLSVYSERIEDIIFRLQPDIDKRILDLCLNNVKTFNDWNINQHQITLTQWVMDPVIPSRGIPYLNKQALLKVMAISQAVLWHRGFYDLAKLITARAHSIEGDDTRTFIAYEGRTLIPKQLMEELDVLYPYYPKLQNKQQGNRKSNPASKAIDILSKDLIKEEWLLSCPIELSGGDQKMITPPHIKEQLATFLIDKIKRSRNEYS
jgi:hypothetical protein